MDKDLLPAEVGVFITSDKAVADPKAKVSKKEKKSFEQYGFETEQDIVEFIMESATPEDVIMIYSYSKDGIIALNWSGTILDLSDSK